MSDLLDEKQRFLDSLKAHHFEMWKALKEMLEINVRHNDEIRQLRLTLTKLEAIVEEECGPELTARIQARYKAER